MERHEHETKKSETKTPNRVWEATKAFLREPGAWVAGGFIVADLVAAAVLGGWALADWAFVAMFGAALCMMWLYQVSKTYGWFAPATALATA